MKSLRPWREDPEPNTRRPKRPPKVEILATPRNTADLWQDGSPTVWTVGEILERRGEIRQWVDEVPLRPASLMSNPTPPVAWETPLPNTPGERTRSPPPPQGTEEPLERPDPIRDADERLKALWALRTLMRERAKAEEQEGRMSVETTRPPDSHTLDEPAPGPPQGAMEGSKGEERVDTAGSATDGDVHSVTLSLASDPADWPPYDWEPPPPDATPPRPPTPPGRRRVHPYEPLDGDLVGGDLPVQTGDTPPVWWTDLSGVRLTWAGIEAAHAALSPSPDHPEADVPT